MEHTKTDVCVCMSHEPILHENNVCHVDHVKIFILNQPSRGWCPWFDSTHTHLHTSNKQESRCIFAIKSFDAAMKADPSISILFQNNRSLRSTLLIGINDFQALSLRHRCNVDLSSFTQRTFEMTSGKYTKVFCQIIPTFDHFCAMLNTATQNCGTLVIDLAAQNSNNLQEYVFIYKAVVHIPSCINATEL